MKIISLNTYMGHVFEPLMTFVKKHAQDTDVFCFQEIMSSVDPDLVHKDGERRLNLLQEIQSRLPDHDVLFDPTQEDFETNAPFEGQSTLGSAIFYKKKLNVSESGAFFVCNSYNCFKEPDYSTLAHNALYIKIDNLLIVSVHGNSEPANKLDSPVRLSQFKKVLDFLTSRDELKILTGDFNALPETESVKMFEKAGLKNLIAKYNILTTRGSHMRTLFPEYEHGQYGFQEFADYTFVSPEIKVESFEVPDVPISDHLPMIMEINF